MPLSTRTDKELYMALDTLLDGASQILLYRNKRGIELDHRTRLRLEYKLRYALKIVRILIARHKADTIINLKRCMNKDELPWEHKRGSGTRALVRRNYRKYKKLSEYKKCVPIVNFI